MQCQQRGGSIQKGEEKKEENKGLMSIVDWMRSDERRLEEFIRRGTQGPSIYLHLFITLIFNFKLFIKIVYS